MASRRTTGVYMTAIIRDKKGRVLSIGKNSYIKTHPLMSKISNSRGIFDNKKVYLHAEIDAIVKCKRMKKAYSLEVYRIGANGSYMSSKPCEICLSGITNTPIKLIKYMDEESKIIVKKV